MRDAVASDPSFMDLVRGGVRAARANLGPGVVLWVVALAFVASYYFWPAAADALQRLAQFRQQMGLGYAVVSTMLFGGVIPWLVMRLRPLTRRQANLPTLLFFAVFWAEKGIEVDLIYRVQAMIFGDNAAPTTILLKTIIDQGVYVPLWAIPTTVIPYLWRDCGFSFRRTWHELGPNWYRRRVLPVMVANWGVWVPAVAIIYTLPVALQLPLQNLALCLWALMLIFLTGQGERDGAAAGSTAPHR